MKLFAMLTAGVFFFSCAISAQSIASVTPSSCDAGQGLSVSIVCADDQLVSCSQITSWTQCNSTVSRVYFKSGDSVRVASAVSNVQAASLMADIVFPLAGSPLGPWDVAIEHQGGATIWKTGGFILNGLSEPIIDSVWPKSTYQNRKVALNIRGNHTHFKIAQQSSLVKNVTAVSLLGPATAITADSFAVLNCTSLYAYFTLKNSGDTGLFDLKIDQGNGLPSAMLQKALSIQPFSSYSLLDGCIASYQFYDPDTITVDGSDFGNNGAASNVLPAENRFGIQDAAYRFNGENSRITVNDGVSLRPGIITVSAWVKLASLGYDRKILGKNLNGASSDSYNLGIYDDNKIEFFIYNNGWYGSRGAPGGTPLDTGVWYHVAGVYDGLTITTYLNGQEDRRKFVGEVAIQYSTSPFLIGQTPTAGYFKGVIDDIFMYNRALTEDAVYALYTMTNVDKPLSDSTIPVMIPYKPKVTLDPRPKVSWHPVAKAKSYTLTIATDAAFTSIVIKVPLSDTTFAPSVNLPVGTLFWHVKSDLGTRWSTADKIIIQSDTIPFLHRYDGIDIESLKPKFVWNKVANAGLYRIEIAYNASFTDMFVATPIADTAYTPLVNMNAGTCYWRVSSDRNSSLFSTADSLVTSKGTYIRQSKSSIPASYSCAITGMSKGVAFIRLGLPAASDISLKIYSMQGKLLKEISGFKLPGIFQFPIDVHGFSGGFYIVDFKAGAFRTTKRIPNL